MAMLVMLVAAVGRYYDDDDDDDDYNLIPPSTAAGFVATSLASIGRYCKQEHMAISIADVARTRRR